METQVGRDEVLARERLWMLPVGLMTLLGVGLLIVAAIAIRPVSGDGDGEILRAVDEHGSAVALSSALQTLAFALFAAPLAFLFRATAARTPRVRAQLIGLVVAAPLFLSVAAVLNAVATDDAASEFVAGKASADLSAKEARADCRSERDDDRDAFREDYGGKGGGEGALSRCAAKAVSDDAASDAIAEAPARAAATGFALGGRLGLAFTLLYTCLWAMRTGLLTRFWGSLGMALGVAALLLLIQFTLVWFVYFGLLLVGWVPGGRPPAWAAGKAIPWPTPGEKAAAGLGGGDPGSEGASPGGEGNGNGPGGERRKRKRRG
jgi:hypothetical protein